MHPIAAATIAAIAAVVDFKRLIIIHSICFKNNFCIGLSKIIITIIKIMYNFFQKNILPLDN